jgi:hypothetical protein
MDSLKEMAFSFLLTTPRSNASMARMKALNPIQKVELSIAQKYAKGQ